MTIAEFVEQWRQKGESVITVADAAVRAEIDNDKTFIDAARALVQAEDKFYVMMLERGLEQ